jgi:hypothetical protein
MKVQGKIILLEKPVMPSKTSGGIELPEAAIKQLEDEAVRKFTALPVCYIGDEVNKVKPGAKVFVDPTLLVRATIYEDIDNAKLYYIVRESDILIVF